LLWIHGGGFVIGDAEIDREGIIAFVRELGIAVASVNYRLAPQHPFPAPMDDCYSALHWLSTHASSLGLRNDRIAVGGASAGAGLAAGLALLAHDRREVAVAFQLLIYPMLDDRTATRNDPDASKRRLWDSRSNVYGWTSYLNQAPGSPNVSPYASPARRVDLEDLPPAWIGVGTCDLFHDEVVTYARRLKEAGVPCTLRIVEGAFHGFDLCRKAEVVHTFRRDYVAALRSKLSA
jgi:acetyl esterase/lipase